MALNVLLAGTKTLKLRGNLNVFWICAQIQEILRSQFIGLQKSKKHTTEPLRSHLSPEVIDSPPVHPLLPLHHPHCSDYSCTCQNRQRFHRFQPKPMPLASRLPGVAAGPELTRQIHGAPRGPDTPSRIPLCSSGSDRPCGCSPRPSRW